MEVEEKTSHYVQLDDGTYAEMVEGHELVGPGHQMLVEVRILTSDWSKIPKTLFSLVRIKMVRSWWLSTRLLVRLLRQ